jgi:succinate dehydrogenase / fumarate reductase membrane anchor subunit
MPLGEVLVEQLPFAIGMAVAAVAALLFSFLSGLLVGGGDKPSAKPAQGSRFERFWWSYMRISGLLILPLVFGHLAMVHLVQGVFDLTTAGAPIVGTNFINEQGLAVEFVGSRWSFALAGVAVWKLYDMGLLALVTIHGFNGLRYVLTDYTMFSPLLRRASVYLCIIGAVVLLLLGGGALLGSINQASIDMAIESACELGRNLAVCE